MLAHPRVSRPVAHHWAFTFQSAPPRSRASLRGLIRTGHVPASRCFVFLLGTEPGDRTLQTWFVRPRTSPAVLARRGAAYRSRTGLTSWTERLRHPSHQAAWFSRAPDPRARARVTYGFRSRRGCIHSAPGSPAPSRHSLSGENRTPFVSDPNGVPHQSATLR
jgi:hypothetical protein